MSNLSAFILYTLYHITHNLVNGKPKYLLEMGFQRECSLVIACDDNIVFCQSEECKMLGYCGLAKSCV